MQTKATSIAEYFESMPEDRRKAIKKLRALVNKHVPRGYKEGFAWGGITWSVPLSVYPDTYNGHPLCYIGLGSQKHYMALYLLGAYYDGPVRQKLVAGFKAAGKKLDMGKSCLRFRKLDDLPLDVIAQAVASVPAKRYIEIARVHGGRKR